MGRVKHPSGIAWTSTKSEPTPKWDWPGYLAHEAIPEEEAEAIASIHEVIDLTGLVVLDLGCGRGACLNAAKDYGVRKVIGVDQSPYALDAAKRLLDRSDLPYVLCEDEATKVGLPDACADIVWSHGVVEHFKKSELEPYFAEAIRLAGRYVAFSAPNPDSGVYREFRQMRLQEGTWKWGYEEPLSSYATYLRKAGCSVIIDAPICKGAHYGYFKQLPEERQRHWRSRIVAGDEPGIYTLVVAVVPDSFGGEE